MNNPNQLPKEDNRQFATMKTTPLLIAALIGATAVMTTVQAQTAPKMKMTTEIPPQITTPDSVETRLGTLKFFDGFPDDQTVEKVMDNLDFSRGVQSFLSGLPGSSLVGMRAGLGQLGANNSTVAIFEELLTRRRSGLLQTPIPFISPLGWISMTVRWYLRRRRTYWHSSTTSGFTTSSTSATQVQTKAR